MFNLFEQAKIVTGHVPATNDAAVVGDYVKLDAGQKLYAIVNFTGGNVAQSTITAQEATSAAGAGAQNVANTMQIRSNLNTALTDTLVARTAAVNYQTDAAATNKLIVLEISAEKLSAGFNWVRVQAGISNILNIVGITYVITGLRYAQATPPTAIA